MEVDDGDLELELTDWWADVEAVTGRYSTRSNENEW